LHERSRAVVTPALPRWSDTEVVSGRGVYLTLADGRELLDFSAGIATANTGHCHPKVVEAAHRQIDQLIHACIHVSWYPTYVQLAEKLAELVPPLGMAFFGNSGAEAIEAALKLARYSTQRPGIIAFQGAFHGRTLGAASVTAKSALRRRYEPLLPAVYHVPYPWCFRCSYGQRRESCHLECFQALERLLETVVSPDETAAILIEPILGEAGYHVAPDDFLTRLRALCDRYGILLMVDEIQSGMGRTGRMFAWQHVPGFTPDVMTLAKGLASGFPLGAVLARPEVMARWEPGAHGSTFGGNPVSCAAALATLEVLEQEKLVRQAALVGEYLHHELDTLMAEAPIIGDVRGRGLMLAAEFVQPDGRPDPGMLKAVTGRCIDRGLLVIGGGLYANVLRVIPPLIVSMEQARAGMTILSDVVRGLQAEVA
jgi:4-aminobutyrate aminotransferase